MGMERPQFQIVRLRGVLRLPPGFRFHPTDEELLVQYLKRKVFSLPLPAAVIPEIDLENHDPWDLPGGGDEEEERYFFSLRQPKHAKKGSQSARPTRSGYWKAAGKDRPVVAPRPDDRTVGTKRAFAFYLGKPRRGSRTDWFMHEYSLSPDEVLRACSMSHAKNANPQFSSPMFEIKDWVVCRIFKKNRTTKFDAEIEHRSTGIAGLVTMQSSNRRSPSPLSPSSSSCVTDLSDNGEENSSYSVASPL